MSMDMRTAIEEAIEKSKDLWLDKAPDGYKYEIYASYDDELSDGQIIEILKSNDPRLDFYEKVNESYFWYEMEVRGDLGSKIRSALVREDGPFPNGLTASQEDEFELLMEEMVEIQIPFDHYLKQQVRVNIMLDTGDGNFDYVLNATYPSYCGEYKDTVDNKASIVWLAKSQGYTKTQLKNALRSEDKIDYSSREKIGLLASIRKEVLNITSHMNTLTFLVEMSLDDCIRLNELVRLQDRFGHHYDATKNPYCGYVVIDKDTSVGLFDPWYGGGSLFEIELEKDLRLPIKFIRSALPDGGDGYSVSDIYGMCGSAWSDCVKTIHGPLKLTA